MRVWPLACAALLLPATTIAQDSGTVVVVQVQRLDPFRGDGVFSSIDLSADDIARAPSVDQALKSHVQAGLFRRSSSLSANPTVQGIGFRAIAPSGAGRALVQLDGVPMNDPFGGWVIWSSLPQGALGRVHVLRGAGGGAYGAGAITGVIDLTTADSVPYAEAGLADGNSRLSVGGYGLHIESRSLTGDAPVRGADAGAADVPTTGKDLSWLWSGSTPLCDDCGDVSVMVGAYDSDRATGLSGATATATGQHLSLSLTRRPTQSRYGYRVQLWGKASDLKNRSVSVQQGRTGTNLANEQFGTPATGYGFNAALRRVSGAAEWEIGFDTRLNEGEARERYRYMAGAPTRLRIAGGETVTTGIYAEGSWTQGPWLWAAALRVDEWQSRNGHRAETDLTDGTNLLSLRLPDRSRTIATGRLGATYALTPHYSLRGAAYTGFRPPSLNELYRPFRVGNDITEANADLVPETLSGFEIGLRRTGRLNLDATIFANQITDPIGNVTIGSGPGTFPIAGFIPAGGTLRQRQNIGRIDATGIEFSAHYSLSDDWAVRTSATFTDAEVAATGLRPAQAPRSALSLGVTGKIGRFDLWADLTHEGKRFEDDRNQLPLRAATRLDLAAAYALTRQWGLGVEVRNAFDADIAISRTGDGITGYEDGRRIWLSLRWSPN